jgi:pimeloyl-ACP methyl ester carboxylesterase
MALSAGIAALSLAGCGGGGETTPTGAGKSAEQPAGTTEPDSISPADLEPCGALPVPSGFDCGSIQVPVFRSDASFGTTKVGFAFRPHNGPGDPEGTIFAVEGGPGYSSTGTANAFTKAFGDLLDTHDLVLVDQRGTGRSNVLGCPDIQRDRAPQIYAGAECAARLGPEYESYTTANAADDVNAVREALGLDQITLYGDSYGTYLGQSYAYRHPETLQALVLDSAYPVRGEAAWYPSLPRTGIRSLATVCERDPDCHGDALARLARVTKSLRETGRGAGPLIDAISEAGAYGAPGSYRRINDAVSALLEGHPGPYRDLIHIEKPGLKHPRQYSKAIEYVVGCNDYPMVWDRNASEPERRAQLEESIRGYDRKAFTPFTPREVMLSSDLGYLECLAWPPPTERREPPIREDMEPTTAPVLVLSGELDDVTTPIENRWVAESFPNSKLVRIPNASHADALYHADGYSARTMRRFLRKVYAGKDATGDGA